MSFRVLTVVGARPQFIKAVPISLALKSADVEEVLVHTGQHYDYNLSGIFFDRLGLKKPDFHLGVGSFSHSIQTAKIMEKIEPILMKSAPDIVLLYGDTNSTLAAAISAAKLGLPIAHIESGLRDYDRDVPEEINRRITDHLSILLFAPTDLAVRNLAREGLTHGVFQTGDVMFDTALMFRDAVEALAESIPKHYGVKPKEYYFVTVHRSENTGNIKNWEGIVAGLKKIAREIFPVIWAAHPRTKGLISDLDEKRIKIIDPQPYFETQSLILNARAVVTDSGGIQKEAFFNKVPCVILRDCTPWQELVDAGANICVGTDPHQIEEGVRRAAWSDEYDHLHLYGDGHASKTIVSLLRKYFESPGILKWDPGPELNSA